MTYLEERLKESYSIESKDPDEEVILLGCVECGDRVRYVYEGQSRYWYETRFKVGDRIISEYEKVFEHPEQSKYQRKFYAKKNQAAGEGNEDNRNNKRQETETTGEIYRDRNVC